MSEKLEFYKETRFKKTEIGEIPEDWKTTPIGKIVKEVKLRNDSKENLTVFAVTKYSGLIPSLLYFRKRVFSQELGKYKIIKKKQFAYSPIHLNEGGIGLLEKENKGLVSPLHVVFELLPEANPYFFKYLLKSHRLLSFYSRLPKGSIERRGSILFRDFSKICVQLPSPEEQRKIATTFLAIEEAIQKTDEIVGKIQELKKGLMQRLLTKGIAHTRFKTTEIGEIPEEWEIIKLGDALAFCQYGLSIPLKDIGKHPIIRMDGIVDGYVIPDVKKFVDLDDETFRTFKVEKGDVLFNRTNSYELVGKTGTFLLTGNYVFASYLIRLRLRREMFEPHFLTLYVNFSQNRLKRLATRAIAQANINSTNLKKFKVVRPSLEEQLRIVSILTELDEEIEEERKTKEQLEKTKKWFMQNLLAGKIRVKVD